MFIVEAPSHSLDCSGILCAAQAFLELMVIKADLKLAVILLLQLSEG